LPPLDVQLCCKTHELDEGKMEGMLHVPVLQDNTTGCLHVPEGTTEVKGNAKLHRREESFAAVLGRPTADAPL